MLRLKIREKQAIFDMFENEIKGINNIDRYERMGLRKRIHRILKPALDKRNQTPQTIMSTVEDGLIDIVFQFRDGNGFLKKLSAFLDQKKNVGHSW